MCVCRWLFDGIGGGGPKSPSGEPLLNGAFPNLSREVMLDRFNSHTKHCKKCMRTLSWVHALKEISLVLSSVMAASALFVIGMAWKGATGTNKVSIFVSLLGACVFLFVYRKLSFMESLYYFRDYKHWKS